MGLVAGFTGGRLGGVLRSNVAPINVNVVNGRGCSVSERRVPTLDVLKRLDAYHGAPRCPRWDGCVVCDAAYEIEILRARLEKRRG